MIVIILTLPSCSCGLSWAWQKSLYGCRMPHVKWNNKIEHFSTLGEGDLRKSCTNSLVQSLDLNKCNCKCSNLAKVDAIFLNIIPLQYFNWHFSDKTFSNAFHISSRTLAIEIILNFTTYIHSMLQNSIINFSLSF